MLKQNYLRFVLSFAFFFSVFTVTLPGNVYAQTVERAQISGNLQSRLAKIEEKVEARRKELGIPGMALAIVKDGQVIYLKGLGYKNFEKQIPVTPDTQFAIGSASKAFTALSVLMSRDQGKLDLDAHPGNYLSYFKINDPEINEKITVKDLLTHSSGLNRTDLGWITGKLNREEMIRVAGEAKPTAKLRERFLYQNVMYAAAGEIVARVQNTTWENFVAQEILKPLGMLNTTVSVPEMQKSKDYSLGYDYNFDTKKTRNLPTRDLKWIAPAGSINSSARDMANWLKFVLNGGELNGRRLISEESFEEWLKPHQKISNRMSYGLGWFLQESNGKKVVQHGGNIDGFNSLVAMMPEEKLGFVMLTNVSGSSLGGELMPIIWNGILGDNEQKAPTTSADSGKETGIYRFEAAGFDIEIKMQDKKLVAVVPNQPTYILENIGGRKYKLTNAPEGFFVTFKDTELYLEQPQGNYTLPKIGAESKADAKQSGAVKELIGRYESEEAKGNFIEVKDIEGKISLVVSHQPPYPLIEREKDNFGSQALPDSYRVKVSRDENGKVASITLSQPQGDFKFKYVGEIKITEAPEITVEELMVKTIEAAGGETNWRKINSRMTKFDIDFVHQGLKGAGTSYQKAPNMSASRITISAFGRPIATIDDYFDGTNSIEKTSFAPEERHSGRRLEDIKLARDFYGLLNWKKDLKEAKIEGIEKVGGEEAYKVVFQMEKASSITYYISTKTFLPLKQESVVVSSTSSQTIPVSQTFSDYREVDGVMVPFKTVSSNTGIGETVIYVKEIKHNVKIDDKTFKP